MSRFFICLTIALWSICAQAVENPGFTDNVRFSLGSAPGVEEWEQGGTTFDDEAQVGIAFQLSWLFKTTKESGFGVIWGPSLFYNGHQATANTVGGDVDYSYGAGGLGFTLGAVYQVTPAVSVELKPYYNFGFGSILPPKSNQDFYEEYGFESPFPEEEEPEDPYGTGVYNAYGVDLGLYYHFDSFHMGIDVGYMSFVGISSYDYGSKAELVGDGISIKFSAGTHF